MAIVNIRYKEISSVNTAEQQALLDTVTRKRLVKTLQAGKVFVAVICKVWK
jgi:hypothetical protein